MYRPTFPEQQNGQGLGVSPNLCPTSDAHITCRESNRSVMLTPGR